MKDWSMVLTVDQEQEALVKKDEKGFVLSLGHKLIRDMGESGGWNEVLIAIANAFNQNADKIEYLSRRKKGDTCPDCGGKNMEKEAPTSAYEKGVKLGKMLGQAVDGGEKGEEFLDNLLVHVESLAPDFNLTTATEGTDSQCAT
jgi:hypothetical protein